MYMCIATDDILYQCLLSSTLFAKPNGCSQQPLQVIIMTNRDYPFGTSQLLIQPGQVVERKLHTSTVLLHLLHLPTWHSLRHLLVGWCRAHVHGLMPTHIGSAHSQGTQLVGN